MKTSPAALLPRVCARMGDARPMPPTVVIIAHPDDETVGLGGRLPRFTQATFVYVTDGAPRNLHDARTAGYATRPAYARARRDELHTALGLAGIEAEKIKPLGLADQEASSHLVDLSQQLSDMLRTIAPKVVITHPYEGGHPDHDATAFCVHTACRLLEQQGLPAPTLVEMASYHNRNGTMITGDFLPAPASDVVTQTLSARERTLKQRLLDCYITQKRTLRHFSVEVERSRLAPHYDFECAPHEGRMLYELFGWNMTGCRWRHRASAALDTLGLHRTNAPADPAGHTF